MTRRSYKVESNCPSQKTSPPPGSWPVAATNLLLWSLCHSIPQHASDPLQLQHACAWVLKLRVSSLSMQGGRKFRISPQCKMKSLRSSLQRFHLCYLPRESPPFSSLQFRLYFWELSCCCVSPCCLVPARLGSSQMSSSAWWGGPGAGMSFWRSAAKGASVSKMLKTGQITLEMKWLLWTPINSTASSYK